MGERAHADFSSPKKGGDKLQSGPGINLSSAGGAWSPSNPGGSGCREHATLTHVHSKRKSACPWLVRHNSGARDTEPRGKGLEKTSIVNFGQSRISRHLGLKKVLIRTGEGAG